MKLNREEILAMPAGRELDELVAERVMGWNRDNGSVMYRDKDDVPQGRTVSYWNPSTDISEAMEAEAKAMEKDDLIYAAALMQVCWNDTDYITSVDPCNMVEWTYLSDLIHANPEQRCKAALLALLEVSP